MWFVAGTVAVSTIFANLQDSQGKTAAAARLISNATSYAFPWISNFRRSRSDWLISDLQALKIESIHSTWFIFGLAVAIVFGVMMSKQPLEDRHRHEEALRQHKKTPSGYLVFFSILFVVLGIVPMTYLGWASFGEHWSSRGCLLSVRCYYQDDLKIIAAAGLNSLALFFSISSVALMVRFLFSRQES